MAAIGLLYASMLLTILDSCLASNSSKKQLTSSTLLQSNRGPVASPTQTLNWWMKKQENEACWVWWAHLRLQSLEWVALKIHSKSKSTHSSLVYKQNSTTGKEEIGVNRLFHTCITLQKLEETYDVLAIAVTVGALRIWLAIFED